MSFCHSLNTVCKLLVRFSSHVSAVRGYLWVTFFIYHTAGFLSFETIYNQNRLSHFFNDGGGGDD